MQVKTSQLLSFYQSQTRDTTAANQTLGKQLIAYYYTYLMGMISNYTIEKTKYGSTKTSQRSYLLPPDYIKMKTVRLLYNNVWYSLQEIESMNKWGLLTSYTYNTAIPSGWIVINQNGNMYLELDPVPITNGAQNIEIVYEGYHDPLYFPTDVTSPGSISINQGSAAVTGSGTTFPTTAAGLFIQPTGGKYWYDIASYVSGTALTLVNFFQEANVSDVGYTIAEMSRLPAEYDYTPVWGAARDYYRPTNTLKAREYDTLYIRDMQSLTKKYQSKTKGRVMPGIPVARNYPQYPRNYPKNLLTKI